MCGSEHMRHYCAQVSTEKSGGGVVVDLGDCESAESARARFNAFRLCLHNDKIKIEVMEYGQLMEGKAEGTANGKQDGN